MGIFSNFKQNMGGLFAPGDGGSKFMDQMNTPQAQIAMRLLQASQGAPGKPAGSLGAIFGDSVMGYQNDAQQQQMQKLQMELLRAQTSKMNKPDAVDRGRLVTVTGADGKPTYQYEADAAGQTPYIEPKGTAGQAGEIDIARALNDPNIPENVRRDLRSLIDKKYRDPAGEPMVPVQTPQGVVYMPRSQVAGRSVPQPDSAAKPTIGEQQAAMLATRLRGAQEGLAKLGASSATPGVMENIAKGTPLIGGETAANAFRSSDRQQADAMQVDALDAALTLATGATYTPEQIQNARKSYFPQLLDSEKTKKSKEERFNTLVKAAMERAGAASPAINRAMGISSPASGNENDPLGIRR
jgi:hypothetical protein